MSYFNGMNISASGLTAQRLRMDTIAENIANATTTRTENGTPYVRRNVVFEEIGGFQGVLYDKMNNAAGGVRVSSIVEDPTPLKLVYDPSHPDANEEGYVEMPNVDTVKEMVDMIAASRAYEANITAINNFKSMAMKALEIGR